MEIVRYAVLGLGTGALYALIAAGLVTVYRGSGIVNFAQGAFVMVGGYADYEFTTRAGLGFWPAMILTIAVTALLGALVQLVVLRPMRNSSPLTRVGSVRQYGPLPFAEERHGDRDRRQRADGEQRPAECTPRVGAKETGEEEAGARARHAAGSGDNGDFRDGHVVRLHGRFLSRLPKSKLQSRVCAPAPNR